MALANIDFIDNETADKNIYLDYKKIFNNNTNTAH